MDFRSQLSAFQSNSGNNNNSNSNRNNRNQNTQERNNHQGSSYHRGGDRRSNDHPHSRPRSYSSDRGGGYYGGRGGSNNHHHNSHQSYGGGGRDSYRHHDDRRRGRDDRGNVGGPPHSRRRYNSPDPDGLGELRRFDYKVIQGFPPAPTVEEKNKKTKHVALLVICIDGLPYEHLWKAWMEHLGSNSDDDDDLYISLVVHAKFPEKIESPWLKERLLVYPPKVGRGNSFLKPEYLSRQPKWGSVEITRVMMDLLQDAAKIGVDTQQDERFSTNRYVTRRPPSSSTPEEAATSSTSPSASAGAPPPVDQFVFLSETCLPVATAAEVFDSMADTTVSWVNARHRQEEGTPKNKYEDDQFAGIHRRIPGQYRWKADQWVLLCRDHVTNILALDRPHKSIKYQIWQLFRDINASDEMYFPTVLAVLGYLRYAEDGEDTQRRRIGTTPANKSSTPKDDGDSAAVDNPATTVPAANAEKVEAVLKRPITYTDWTEGMRNPASFTKGIADFKKVARSARNAGCLFARKFAPFINIPGMTPGDQVRTGDISVEEWLTELDVLKTEFKDKIPDWPTAAPAKTSDDGPTAGQNDKSATEATEETNKAEPENDSPKLAPANTDEETEKPKEDKKSDADDDDDDEAENELE